MPWKRGLLFAGPPGNDKTHTVKALANALGQPILYVRSFRHAGPDENSIQAVFERARAAAPCVLVLEDLDALVTRENRSFFLNEMDGFAVNGGILTLATTNYPQRLDPAIVKRPSRFDRTYRFDLSGVEERAEYIRLWNEAAQLEMRLGAVAAGTDGFSFAYLNELFLSAGLCWSIQHSPGAMKPVMCSQVELPRQQMDALGSHDDGDGHNPLG